MYKPFNWKCFSMVIVITLYRMVALELCIYRSDELNPTLTVWQNLAWVSFIESKINSHRAVLLGNCFSKTLYNVDLNFSTCGWKPTVWSFKSVKATEQYFLVLLFSLLSMVVLTVDSVNQILKCWTIQMKATEQYFPLLLHNLCCARWV